MDFTKKIEKLWNEKKFVCVGLDPDIAKLPQIVKKNNSSIKKQIVTFNKEIIDATHDVVCCYKPNSAFYEAYGTDGWEALIETCTYIKSKYSQLPILLDFKRGDIENTNLGYIKAAFENIQADAVTIQPYQGRHAIQPFLDRSDKMIFVLVKTSNIGSDEFQNLEFRDNKLLFELVAEHVAREWNENNNCGVVVGATYPKEMTSVRKIVGDMPILIPGIGTQGGDIKNTIQAGKNSKNSGMIINSSRGIIYASNRRNFAEAARRETEKMTKIIQDNL